MSSSYQATGIVIGRTNFGEADRIIRLFTPEYGKLSAVARGVRRIKSRAAGHLEPFGETSLMLASGRGNLDVITSARLQWYPHQLTATYEHLEAAFRLAAILDRLTEPAQPHPKAYHALSGLLHALNDTGHNSTLELWYKLHLLDALGYRPELAHCITCGYAQADRGFAFDAVRGGLVCTDCAEAGLAQISIPAIKLSRLMCDHSYASITNLAHADSLSHEILPLIDAFLAYHVAN